MSTPYFPEFTIFNRHSIKNVLSCRSIYGFHRAKLIQFAEDDIIQLKHSCVQKYVKDSWREIQRILKIVIYINIAKWNESKEKTESQIVLTCNTCELVIVCLIFLHLLLVMTLVSTAYIECVYVECVSRWRRMNRRVELCASLDTNGKQDFQKNYSQ